MNEPTFRQALVGLEDLGRNFYHQLPYIGLAIVIFLIFYVLSKAVRKLTRRLTQKRTRHYKVAFIFGHFAQAVLVILGTLIAMTVAVPSFNIGQIIQLLGITSVAVGFAFKDIFQNFLAGLIILMTEPFRIGDQIKCGEMEGTVEDIQTRATMIRTYDHRRIVFPNANLFTNAITVNTAFENRRLSVEIPLGYKDDIGAAKKTILNALRGLDRILDNPEPDVVVKEVNSSGVILRVRWWIAPPVRFEATNSQDAVLMAIKKSLTENAEEFPPMQSQFVLVRTETKSPNGDHLNGKDTETSINRITD